MPAFQSLAGTGQKRKSDESDMSLPGRKKQALELPAMGSTAKSLNAEQYWMVQWYASTSYE
jgi:hypothetical protein